VLECAVHELKDLRLQVVERKDSALWNEYIDRYHYLGYKPLLGAQLRYFAYAAGRVVGLFGFSAAAWKTGPRDAYIGWSRDQRHRNLGYVVNNSRYLILPWVRVRSLASKLLAMAARVLPAEWETRYRCTGRCCWKALWKQSVFRAPVIGRRTGAAWARPRGGASSAITASGRCPSNRSGCMPWRKISGSSCADKRQAPGAACARGRGSRAPDRPGRARRLERGRAKTSGPGAAGFLMAAVDAFGDAHQYRPPEACALRSEDRKAPACKG
jgi:hypothetical protein